MVVFKRFHWASPSYSQRKCFFNGPGKILASRSVTLTLRISRQKKRWGPLPHKFPLLPTHGLFSANGNSSSVTRPSGQGCSGRVRDACWPDRWDPWRCSGCLSERHTAILNTSFTKKFSEGKGSYSYGVLEPPAQQGEWLSFIWLGVSSSSNSQRIYG